MNPDYKWLSEYLVSEIKRLGEVERFLKEEVAKKTGDIAKWKALEASGTKSPDECAKMLRFCEHKIGEAQDKLSRVSPKLDKLTEQQLIITKLINE